MIEQTMFSHSFVFRARFSVVVVRVDRDAAAGRELAPHFEITWLHQLDEVFPDDVDAVFVEIAVVAEAEQVQLERFRLDELLVRDV